MRDMATQVRNAWFCGIFMKTTISQNTNIPLNAMTSSLLFCHPLNRALLFCAEAGFNYLFFIAYLPMV
jgi:hypothetical protein